MYESIEFLKEFGAAFLTLMGAGIIFRIAYKIMRLQIDGQTEEIWKCLKHYFAVAIIAVTLGSTIAVIAGYFQ